MISYSKIIEIFCKIDTFNKLSRTDFMLEYDKIVAQSGISTINAKKKRNRKFTMSYSEVMTIMILFHLKSYRNFKNFYISHVFNHMQDFFPNCVSYNRIVELQKRVVQVLGVYLKMRGLGKCT